MFLPTGCEETSQNCQKTNTPPAYVDTFSAKYKD